MSKLIAKKALMPHPDTPVRDYRVGAKLSRFGTDVLMIEFALSGRLSEIRLPDPRIPAFEDDLWKSTCFELFLGGAGRGYAEFNFAPSRLWAAYRFESYREGMQRATDLSPPLLFPERTSDSRFGLTALVELGSLQIESPARLGLSAVIEEANGRKSYWALAHPPGKPDFHHSDCFVLELPAAVPA
jgi:hypothetical protein